jgi:hypothetical protein
LRSAVKRDRWYILFGAVLIVSSALLYLLHYAIFRDAHHIYIYLLSDIAFLPLEVLVVTLIVDTLLSSRDKRAALEKMNMVIGAFFSEVGTSLLRDLCRFDPAADSKRSLLARRGAWKDTEFAHLRNELRDMSFACESRAGGLEPVRELLVAKRDFMVRLLENPMLLEHESFTDLLWAVFHLTEELASRPALVGLPGADLDHLSGDMGRAYGLLAAQWLDYMRHLESAYPYLFSLAVRLNPFDPDAEATIDTA